MVADGVLGMKEIESRHDTLSLSAHYPSDQEARGVPRNTWREGASQFRVDRAIRELRSLLESGVSPHVMGCLVRALRELES